MRRHDMQRRSYRRYLRGPMLAVMLATIACSGDVNFNPVAPEWPDGWQQSGLEDRMLEISGTLTSAEGSVLEAAILYDGVEIQGGRSICARPRGCGRLQLEGDVRSKAGRHTISFQVLRQAGEFVDYTAQGTVLVTRDGFVPSLGQGWLVSIPLEATEAHLRAGDSVDYEIEFAD